MINLGLGSVTMIGKEAFVSTAKSADGYVIFGPYFHVEPGDFIVEFGLHDADSGEAPHEKVAVLDVVGQSGQTQLAFREIMAGELKRDALSLFRLSFHLAQKNTLEFRVRVTGARKLAVRLRRQLIDARGVTNFPPLVPDPAEASGGGAGQTSERFSRFASLDQAILEADGSVPLFWVTSSPTIPWGNFGDALSPVIVAALSGLASIPTSANGPNVRLVSAGTVLNGQREGLAHIWGTGLDPRLDSHLQPVPQGYSKPPDVKLQIHAVRGELTRRKLLASGVECPAVFGDPGWLLPRIIPPAVEKTHELGIIPHISEFETQTPQSPILKDIKRYDAGGERGVKIISTRHAPTWEGFVEKIHEITSCKRIITRSFHGLIVPQAYGIPAIQLFAYANDGLGVADLRDDASMIDHRIRDFMLGAGYASMPRYARRANERTDWDDVIRAIDASCETPKIDDEAFIEAFPVTLRRPEDRWKLSDRLAAQIRF